MRHKRMMACGIILFLAVTVASCENPSSSQVTPASIYQSCLEVFKRKGDPMGVGGKMCESMRTACEQNIESEECKKAQRMIKNG